MEEKNSNQETEVRSQENMGEQSAEGGQVNQAELTDQTNQVGEIPSDIVMSVFPEKEAQVLKTVISQVNTIMSGKRIFSADLVMTAIRNTQHGVTFEVQNPEGFNIQGFSHIQMDRKSFPVDDDFNMSFINAPFKEPKELVVKRDGFKKYTKMRLVILIEE